MISLVTFIPPTAKNRSKDLWRCAEGRDTGAVVTAFASLVLLGTATKVIEDQPRIRFLRGASLRDGPFTIATSESVH